MPEVRHVVAAGHEGQRLDNFLLGELKGVPRSRVYRMIRSGEVRVNGRRTKPHARLAKDDRVRIPPVTQSTENKIPRPNAAWMAKLHSSVIFENEDLLVLNKPTGMAVQGGTGEPYGIAETLRETFELDELQLAHRLDKATSGCLVVTKNRKTMNTYHTWFRQRAIQKTYQLIVEGRWPRELSSIDEPLERFKLANGERRVRVNPEGQQATTEFEVLSICRGGTWLAARPLTGRTHQLRVHTQNAGHPVVGDRKYGSRVLEPRPPRLMLHAQALVLPNIGTVEAPTPAEFQIYWTRLKGAG